MYNVRVHLAPRARAVDEPHHVERLDLDLDLEATFVERGGVEEAVDELRDARELARNHG